MQSLTLEYITRERDNMLNFETTRDLASTHLIDIDRQVNAARSAVTSDPLSEDTSKQIKAVWTMFDKAERLEQRDSIKAKLRHMESMLTNRAIWDWIEFTAHTRIVQVIQGQAQGLCWFDGIIGLVDNLILTATPSRVIYPQSYTSMPLAPFHYTATDRRHNAFSNLEKESLIINKTTEIISQWLGFDMDSISRRRAWLTRKLVVACGEEVLLLDKVWEAHCHMKTVIFHNRKMTRITQEKLDGMDVTLRNHNISCVGQLEQSTLVEIGLIARRLRNPQNVSTTKVIEALPRNPSMANTSGGVMAPGLHRFAAYLRRMLPLLDTDFSISNTSDRLLMAAHASMDELLPFQERAPSRLRVQGPNGPYREDHIRTRVGIFNAVSFRAIFYRANVLMEPDFPVFYPDLLALQKAIEGRDIDDVRHIKAYHSPNKFRDPVHADTYWKYSTRWPPLLEEGPIEFETCLSFLSHNNPNYFPQLGSLSAFLTAGDLAYTSTVYMPSAHIVGKCIGAIHKGSASAMKELRLVGQTVSKGKNVNAYITGATNLHNFLLNELSAEEIERMRYEQLTMEHALCKFHIAVSKKLM